MAAAHDHAVARPASALIIHLQASPAIPARVVHHAPPGDGGRRHRASKGPFLAPLPWLGREPHGHPGGRIPIEAPSIEPKANVDPVERRSPSHVEDLGRFHLRLGDGLNPETGPLPENQTVKMPQALAHESADGAGVTADQRLLYQGISGLAYPGQTRRIEGRVGDPDGGHAGRHVTSRAGDLVDGLVGRCRGLDSVTTPIAPRS